jgi:hypothetical protein
VQFVLAEVGNGSIMKVGRVERELGEAWERKDGRGDQRMARREGLGRERGLGK